MNQLVNFKEKHDGQIIDSYDQSSLLDDTHPNHAQENPRGMLKVSKNHPPLFMIENLEYVFIKELKQEMGITFTSQIELKIVDEALLEVDWFNAMHEGLKRFECNYVWSLFPCSNH